MNRITTAAILAGVISYALGIYFFFSHSENYVFLFDFVVLGIMISLFPIGLVDILKQRKIRGIEDRLPDFLRDVAEASKFGSNLADSIISASSGQYGILDAEIKKVSAQIQWGVSIEEALNDMIERLNSPFVTKVITTVIESDKSGGNVSEILNLIAENSKETQLLAKEKYSQLSSYTIILFIAFGVFLLTVLILNTQFFPQMLKGSGSSSIGSVALINVSAIPLIRVIFTGVVIVHGVGDGIMAGVLKDGRYQSGLVFGAVLTLIGYLILFFTGGV